MSGIIVVLVVAFLIGVVIAITVHLFINKKDEQVINLTEENFVDQPELLKSKTIQPKEAYYYNTIVDTSSQNKEVEPVIVQVPKHIHEEFVKSLIGDNALELKAFDKPVEFFKFDNSDSLIRILPAGPNKKLEKSGNFYTARIHSIGYKQSRCGKILVDAKWVGECDLCKKYNQMWAQYAKNAQLVDRDDFNNIKPIERYYYNIIVYVDGEQIQKVWSTGKLVHQQIQSNDLTKHSHFRVTKTIKNGYYDYPYPIYVLTPINPFEANEVTHVYDLEKLFKQ